MTFARSWKQEMIHASNMKPAVPETDRHARAQDGADLARLRARVELSGQQVCAPAFSERRPACRQR